VEEERPLSVTLCEVTSEESREDWLPYAVVGPYSTCEVAGWSVAQMTRAPLVDGVEATALIVGGVPPGVFDTVTLTEELAVKLPWESRATAPRKCVPSVVVVVFQEVE